MCMEVARKTAEDLSLVSRAEFEPGTVEYEAGKIIWFFANNALSVCRLQ
jgi:hypothetical protein